MLTHWRVMSGARVATRGESEGGGVVAKGTVFASMGAFAGEEHRAATRMVQESVGSARNGGRWTGDRQLTRQKAGVSCPGTVSALAGGQGQRQMGNPG